MMEAKEANKKWWYGGYFPLFRYKEDLHTTIHEERP